MNLPELPTIDKVLSADQHMIETTRLYDHGPRGQLPLTEDMLLNEPSGNLFGLTQNVGMGWLPEEVGRSQYLILSTHGGVRAAAGTPLSHGCHTRHCGVDLLVCA